MRDPLYEAASRRAFLGGVGAAMAIAGTPEEPEVDPYQLLVREGRYLPLYTASLRRTDGLTPQVAALVGDEVRALRDAHTNNFDGLPWPQDAMAVAALDAVVRAASDRRVVMINEAHSASRHRSFFGRLLQDCRLAGFTHVAAEAFRNPEGGEASIRDFDGRRGLSPSFGFYLCDPVYADLIRLAATLGYRFWPYEQTDGQRGNDDPSSPGAIGRRERAQATNLAAELDRHPDAKVLVLAGYGHIRKSGGMFANVLQELTGEKVLAIEQASMGSFGPHAQDGALASAVLERFRPDKPIVLRQGGRYWSDPGTDIAVFHPSLPDVNGRPGWLADCSSRRAYRTEAPFMGERLLLRATPVHEGPPAVPSDHVMVTGQGAIIFYLRPGEYRLEVESLSEVKFLRNITVV